MNKLTDDIAKKINTLLLEVPAVKEFKYYQNLLIKKGFDKKEAELKDMQKKLLKAKAMDSYEYEELYAFYKKEYDHFINHPIVSNYMAYKEEKNNYLLEIESIINNGLKID